MTTAAAAMTSLLLLLFAFTAGHEGIASPRLRLLTPEEEVEGAGSHHNRSGLDRRYIDQRLSLIHI